MTLDDRKTIANSDLFDDEQNLAWNAIEGTSKSQLDLNIHDLNDSERNSTVHLERNILPYSKGIQLVIDGAVPFEQKNDDSDFSDNKALMSYLADKYGVMSPKDIEEKYITHIDGKNIKAWVEYEKTCFNMKYMPNYSAEEYNKIASVLNEDSEQAFGIYSDGLDYELVCKGSTDKLYGEYGINLFKSYLQELLTKGEKEHMRILSILGPELQKDIFSFIENMTETPAATKLVDFSNKSLGKDVVDENAAKAILSYIEKRDYELLFEHGKAFVYDPELQEKNEYDMSSLMYYCSDMDSVENDISEEYCTAFDSAWNKFKSLSSNSMDETFKPNNIDSITRLSSLSNGKINEFDAEVILDSLSSQGILVSSRDGNVYSILGSDKKHRLYEIVSLAKNNKFIDDVQMKSLEKILVDLDERIPTDYISIIKKQLKHIVENEPDCDFAVQGKYEKAINLLDELQRTDPLLVKEAAIKSDEIDFDSVEKSMRNSLKNNTQEGKEWGRGIKSLLEEVDNNSYDISGFNQTEISKKDYVHFSERLKQYNEEINSLDKNILVVRKSDFQFDNSLENIIKQKNYIPLETLYNDKEKRMAYIFYDSKEKTYISYTPSTAVGTDKWHERDDLSAARVSAIEFLFNSEKTIMNKKDFSKLYDVIDVYGNILDSESYYDEIENRQNSLSKAITEWNPSSSDIDFEEKDPEHQDNPDYIHFSLGTLPDTIASEIFNDYVNKDGKIDDVVHIDHFIEKNGTKWNRLYREDPLSGEWKTVKEDDNIPAALNQKINETVDTFILKKYKNLDVNKIYFNNNVESMTVSGHEIPMEEFNNDTAVEINRILSENEIDASITGVKFYGDGEFGKKVLVEYKGDISEDALYNVLKHEGVVIEGEKLDCNPIKPDKSGTIEEYLSFQNSMNEAQNKNEEEKIVTESVTFPCGFTLSDKMDRSEMEKEELEMYSRLKAEFDFADNETSTGLFDGTDHNDPSYNINFSIPVPIEAQYPQSKTNEWVSSIEKKLVSKYGAFVSWEGGERTETCFKTKEGARRDELLNNYNIPEYDCHGNSLFETANKSIDSQQKVTDRFVEKLNNLVPSNNTDIEVVLKAAQNALLGFNKEEKNLISKSFIEMGAEKNNFGDILNNALKTRKHSKREVEKEHRKFSRASDGIESL